MTHPRKWLVPTLYIVFLMLPIYGLIAMSFKTTGEILGGFSFFPAEIHPCQLHSHIHRPDLV